MTLTQPLRIVSASLPPFDSRSLTLTLPRSGFVYVYGRSGSGKTTLLKEVLEHEYNRRVELLTNLFHDPTSKLPLKRHSDAIFNLPSLVHVELGQDCRDRMTISEFLGLSYNPTIGSQSKLSTHSSMNASSQQFKSTSQLIQHVATLLEGNRNLLSITSLVECRESTKTTIDQIVARGYDKAFKGGRIIELSRLTQTDELRSPLEVVVDRIIPFQDSKSRLIESIESAFTLASSVVEIRLSSSENIFSELIARLDKSSISCLSPHQEEEQEILQTSSAGPPPEDFNRLQISELSAIIPEIGVEPICGDSQALIKLFGILGELGFSHFPLCTKLNEMSQDDRDILKLAKASYFLEPEVIAIDGLSNSMPPATLKKVRLVLDNLVATGKTAIISSTEHPDSLGIKSNYYYNLNDNTGENRDDDSSESSFEAKSGAHDAIQALGEISIEIDKSNKLTTLQIPFPGFLILPNSLPESLACSIVQKMCAQFSKAKEINDKCVRLDRHSKLIWKPSSLQSQRHLTLRSAQFDDFKMSVRLENKQIISVSDIISPLAHSFSVTTAARIKGLKVSDIRSLIINSVRNTVDKDQLTLAELLIYKDVRLIDLKNLNIEQLWKSFGMELGKTLKPFLDLGLSNIRLNQTISSLSSGEKRRFNLVKLLSPKSAGHLRILNRCSQDIDLGNLKKSYRYMLEFVRRGNCVVLIDCHPYLTELANQGL